MKNINLKQSISLSSIDTAEFQPKSRVAENTLKALKASLASPLGLVYPLVVVERGERFSLVDGHRRHAALTALGETYVPCIIVDHDQATAFAEVNGHHRAMRGEDQQEIFLMDPNALTASQQKSQKAAFNYFGEDFYRQVTRDRVAVLTSLKGECQRVESIMHAHDPLFLRKRDTKWLGARVLAIGARVIRNVATSKELSDLGKANRLKDLLLS